MHSGWFLCVTFAKKIFIFLFFLTHHTTRKPHEIMSVTLIGIVAKAHALLIKKFISTFFYIPFLCETVDDNWYTARREVLKISISQFNFPVGLGLFLYSIGLTYWKAVASVWKINPSFSWKHIKHFTQFGIFISILFNSEASLGKCT